MAGYGLPFYSFGNKLTTNQVKTFFEFVQDYFSNNTNVNNGILWLFGILILASLITVLYFILLPNFKKEKSGEPNEPDEKVDLPVLTVESSADFFDGRVGKAFPGVRGLVWFESPDEAIKRIQLLLQKPLIFRSSKTVDYPDVNPIWWFRGSAALSIKSINIIKQGFFQPNLVRLNSNEYIISKIAIYSSSDYYRNFIYVETEPSKSSGANKISVQDIEQDILRWGYCSEEFATINDKIIKRTEYDDGAAVIHGKMIETNGAKLVTRYLSKYNFIISGQRSAFNVLKYQGDQTQLFNSILQGDSSAEDLVNHVNSIRKDEIFKDR